MVLFVLMDRLVLAPGIEKLNALDNEIKRQESTTKKNLRLLSQKGKIKQEEDKYAVFLNKNAKQFDSDDTAKILRIIENMTKEYSLRIIDLKPLDTEKDTKALEFFISLDCEAKIENIISFIHGIEYSKNILRVNKINIIVQSPDTGMVKSNIIISKPIIQ